VGNQAEWDALVAAAKREGTVVLAGPTSQEFRAAVVKAFEARFGIPMEYLALPGAEAGARIMREGDAGKVTVDVMMGGGGELISLYPAGRLDPIKPNLALLDVTDMSKWADGKLKWMDPDSQYLLQTTEAVGSGLWVNAQQVPEGTITSWKDLLKPEYKGKLASFDPRREGAGLATATYLYMQFGAEYVRDLYLGQQITYTTDERQLAEWVGRGAYPMGLSLVQRQVEPMRELGVNMNPVRPPDGPGFLVGGFSVIKLIKNRPHANAGIVLANWLASQEGQQVYSREVVDVSRRTDVENAHVPAYLRRRPGVEYLDTYEGQFYSTTRQRILAELRQLLGT
jgi:ABC-type Fe3+ transport system substrate-binding protein